MKIRNGFVSNSSSSSFIVGFETIPKTRKELCLLMFGTMEGTVEKYDIEITFEKAAQLAFKQIKKAPRIKTIEDFVEELYGGVFDGYPWKECRKLDDKENKMFREYHKKLGEAVFEDPGYKKERNEIWDEQREMIRSAAAKIAEEKLKEWDGLELLVFTFSDHDSDGSVMEHGRVFQKIPYVRVNNH